MLIQGEKKLRLFISYSHDDEAYFKVFSEGLKKVTKNTEYFEWSVWDDTKIHVGTFWDDAIQNNIEDCTVAMLLVSVGFMASDYIRETEYKAFKDKYAEKGILIIPIVFKPCDFNRWDDLGKLQFFKPRGSNYGKPEIDNFTFSDLIKFNETNGTLIPNPNSDRYILDLVKKVEESYRDFLKHQESKIVIDTIPNEVSNFNKLSNAPTPRPYFTGREKEIEDFHKAVEDRITLIAIDGAGGIGKTQFVSRFIERYIPHDKVIWFECSPASQFDTLISESGYPELLKGSSKTDREKFSAFKDKIQDNGFFVFLDNFQETNNNPVFKEFLIFIQEYLHSGCVIVIDRDDIRSVNLSPKRIHIEGFREKKLEYAKALIAHSYTDDVKIGDDELESLCEQLQGYPLAIDFAIYLLSQGESHLELISKIVQQGSVDQISERLLNAIFSRPDATPEEKEFIKQFSVFIGSVSEETVVAVIPDSTTQGAPRKLQRKNILTFSNGYYEIHPLVREFCYKELAEKEKVHAKVADYYMKQRTTQLSPTLEEQIFYHLLKSNQWYKIEQEIEDKGRQFILLGQLGLVKEFLDKLQIIGINKPIFNIFYGDIAEIQGEWEKALQFFHLSRNNTIDNKIKAIGIIKYGEIQYRKGNIKEAVILFEEAYFISKENSFKKEEADSLNDIGNVFEIFGNYNTSLEKYNEALKIRIEINDIEGIASSLTNIGSIYYSKGQLSESLNKIEESLLLAQKIGNKLGIAGSFRKIGSIFLIRGEFNNALINFEESLIIEKEIGNKTGIAASTRLISSIYQYRGEIITALRLIDVSLKIEREIGNKHGISASISSMGDIYLLKGEFNEALNKYKESLEINKSIEDKAGIAVSFLSIGNVYYKKEKYEKALKIFEECLQIFTEIGRRSSIAAALNNIGLSLRGNNKLIEALAKYEESLDIEKKIGNLSGIATTLNNIASLLHSQRKNDEAINMYKESLIINEKIGNIFGTPAIYNNIAVIYSEKQNEDYYLSIFNYFKSLTISNKMGAKLDSQITVRWITKLRDNVVGLKEFKNFALAAFNNLSVEEQHYIPLQELIKEPIRKEVKTNRNEPCPCGSGKKYKLCHGR